MVARDNIDRRLSELLADEAAGNGGAGRSELDQLLRYAPGRERDELMTVAGLVQLACLRADQRNHAPMPRSLRQRLEEQARSWSPVASGSPARD